MNHKVNFHVKCYVFTFSCVILARTLQYTSKKSPKREEGRERSRKDCVFVFQCKIGFMSVVAGRSAPQVSWVYTDKTFNFCVFSFVPVMDRKLFKASLLLYWGAMPALPGYGFYLMFIDDMNETAR